MATGIFTLRNQLQGLIQKAWNAPFAPTYGGNFNGATSTALAVSSTSQFAFGTGNFTIEFWTYLTNPNAQSYLFDMRTGNPLLCYITSNTQIVTDYNTITIPDPSNRWVHWAFSRTSGVIKTFINGVQVDSTAYTSSFTTSGLTILNRYSVTVTTPIGYVSNFRVVNGTGLYTSNFLPPTSALTAITGTALLTLQNQTIVDNSGNSLTITNTGVTTQAVDPFYQPSNSTPAVEYLVVAGGGGGWGGSGGGYGAGGGAGGLIQGISNVTAGTSLTITVGAGGGGNSASGANSVFSAITVIGGGQGGISSGGSGGGAGYAGNGYPTVLGFQGVSGQGNAGGSSIGPPSGSANSGGSGGGGAGTVGLNGFAVSSTGYCGNGGAGIASSINGTVTAYAGGGGGGDATNAGLGGSGGGGAGSYSSTGGNGSTNTGGGGGGGGYGQYGGNGGSGIVIISYPDTYNAPTTLTGTYTASTSGSGSIYYPNAGGSGPTAGATFIQFSNTTALQTGTTATYEAWVYPTAFTTNHRIMSQQGSNSGIEIYYDSSGNVAVGYTSSGANASVSSSPLSLNTWYHIAVVFTSGTMTVYFNGVSKTLSGTTTGYNFTSTNPLFVGSYSNTNQYGIIGYLSNVRIVKGVAVYTGNFTAPTAPFQPTQSAGTNISAITGTQTSLLLNSVSGAFLTDSSTNGYNPAAVSTGSAAPTWNQLSPFATGLGYKNRVYTWTGSGTVTF